ncbi:hypothetical protein ACFQO7_12320 [Catellatospora aurea]|uniref:TetR family transcriptional regulator n=1 Tax=Catellatospora aurea TaxID=1337874 RepID=A0ABW2GVY2_9ACTN
MRESLDHRVAAESSAGEALAHGLLWTLAQRVRGPGRRPEHAVTQPARRSARRVLRRALCGGLISSS